MNAAKVVQELNTQYSGKAIFKNNPTNPTEILCEIEPTSDHPDYSVAIAVIDKSIPHFHHQIEEIYEVLRGNLTLHVNDKEIMLKTGDSYIIKPGTQHYAQGQETWIKTTARPGWTPEDHITSEKYP